MLQSRDGRRISAPASLRCRHRTALRGLAGGLARKRYPSPARSERKRPSERASELQELALRQAPPPPARARPDAAQLEISAPDLVLAWRRLFAPARAAPWPPTCRPEPRCRIRRCRSPTPGIARGL